MGDPTYEAIRARERAEADAAKAFAAAGKATAEAVTNFLTGKASLWVAPSLTGVGGTPSWTIRFLRDPS